MCNKKVSSTSHFETRPTAEKDLQFFESLIDFTIQCTFIAMHRRAFNTICEYQFRDCFALASNISTNLFPRLFFLWRHEACELNRLFRTEFFNFARKKSCWYRFGFREKQVGWMRFGTLMKHFPTDCIFRFFLGLIGTKIHWGISENKCHHWWRNCWYRRSRLRKLLRLERRNILGKIWNWGFWESS